MCLFRLFVISNKRFHSPRELVKCYVRQKKYLFTVYLENKEIYLFNQTVQLNKKWKRVSLCSILMFYQVEHLQAEQLQSVHEHAEPQLVFSSIQQKRY